MSMARVYTGMTHPSISHLSWEHRARLTAAAWNRVTPKRGDRLWDKLAGACILAFDVGMIALWVAGGSHTGVLFCSLLVVLAGTQSLYGVRMFLARRRQFIAELRQQLLEADIRPAVCLVCGYDLRCCESARCSECGTQLRKETLPVPPVGNEPVEGAVRL